VAPYGAHDSGVADPEENSRQLRAHAGHSIEAWDFATADIALASATAARGFMPVRLRAGMHSTRIRA